MRNFCSIAPDFDALIQHRQEVPLPAELQWFAFYGHAVSSPSGKLWFPAYGCFQSRQDHQTSFILETDETMRAWRVISILPEDWDVEVNEASVISHENGWHIFMRQRQKPFGIWTAKSTDGLIWTVPDLLIESAHAPMTISYQSRLLLGFRHILEEERAATSIMWPLESNDHQDLDIYEGNIYDGGYCDFAVIGGRTYAFYYHGNEAAEPGLKCALIA